MTSDQNHFFLLRCLSVGWCSVGLSEVKGVEKYTSPLGRRAQKSMAKGMDKGEKRDKKLGPIIQHVTGIQWNNICEVPGVSRHVVSAL